MIFETQLHQIMRKLLNYRQLLVHCTIWDIG
jgi:hypothetical protein